MTRKGKGYIMASTLLVILFIPILFFFCNYPILIDSESNGGLISQSEFPLIILTRNRTLYFTTLVDHQMVFSHMKINKDHFQKIDDSLLEIKSELKSHYILDGAYDAPDMKLYINNSQLKTMTYIYGTNSSPEWGQYYISSEYLKEFKLESISNLLLELRELRVANGKYKNSRLDMLMILYWQRKLPEYNIIDIRKKESLGITN